LSRRLAAVLALPWLGFGQSYSSHSGWSFSDTLETATDIVVADVTGGTSVDDGAQVTVAATLHIVRVLKGGLPPDSMLDLRFSYKPSFLEGPEVTSKVPAMRALFFLELQAEKGYRPLQASAGFLPMSGLLVPVSHAALVHAPDSSMIARLSQEYGLALEELVTTHQTDFAQDRPVPVTGTKLPPAVATRNRFKALADSLMQLPGDSLPVLQTLSESPLLPLRVLGLAGRLQQGDTGALVEVEKDLPRLTGTRESERFARGMFGLSLADKPAEAHTLARIALADPTLPGFESALAHVLGQMRSPEFLAYSMLLLDSSEDYVRAASIMSTCQMLHNSGDSLWKPEMQPHCPDRAPLNDPPREQADIQFWKDWWAGKREAVAKLVTLPDPRAPARWSNAPREEVAEWRPLPLEARIESLLRQETNRPSHAHDESGAIIAAPESPSIADTLLRNPADRQVFREAAKEAQAKIEEYQARRESLRNTARVGGAAPTREQILATFAEWQSAVKLIVDGLRSRLTPEGWKALETFGDDRGGAAVATAPPQ